MKESDRITSVVLMAIAIIVCIGSIKIGLGTFHTPGSGFVPFIVGIFVALSTLPTLIRPNSGKKLSVTYPQEPINLWKVIKGIIGLFAYILFLPKLGYIIGTFLLMLFFFKGVETLKWRWAIIAAILSVSASYLIFDVLLQCNFPIGLINLRELIPWIF